MSQYLLIAGGMVFLILGLLHVIYTISDIYRPRHLVPLDPALIDQYGAVSAEVASAMAEGARQRSGADHALATTGIAGPGGGSTQKPVGTVFVGMASAHAAPIARKFFFPTDRETFKQMVAQAAFEMLRKALR